MMDDDFPTDRARLLLIDSLAKMRREYDFNPRDMEHLLGLIEAVAKDPRNTLTLASEMVAPANKASPLSKALKSVFTDDHVVWSYVRFI